MLTPLKTEVTGVGDLAHEARRFRTILWSFERNMELLFQSSAQKMTVDHTALALAFSRWRQGFDEAKHLAAINRHDFVIFAAGLMLKELLTAAPLKAASGEPVPQLATGADHPLQRWPEGYAYTSFCLSVAAAILREIGETEPDTASAAEDMAFWDSFRENVADSPASAIAFFDLVCGQTPNWDAPDTPWLRRALRPKLALLEGLSKR
jgi:hypothetical protein